MSHPAEPCARCGYKVLPVGLVDGICASCELRALKIKIGRDIVEAGSEWDIFRRALRRVAAEHGGRVEWTHVRPLVRDRIEHKHIGLMVQRAKREGLLTEIDITRSKDERGKNAGRLEPVYEMRSVA